MAEESDWKRFRRENERNCKILIALAIGFAACYTITVVLTLLL